jgi:hypothetical protein
MRKVTTHLERGRGCWFIKISKNEEGVNERNTYCTKNQGEWEIRLTSEKMRFWIFTRIIPKIGKDNKLVRSKEREVFQFLVSRRETLPRATPKSNHDEEGSKGREMTKVEN